MANNIEKNVDRSIAIYCRVSTDEQAREGVSLDEQQVRLKAYCRAMGWDLTPLVFVDDGYSAKSTDRPQLNKLLAKVKAGELSKIMVTKLDRMSRRLLDLLKMIDLFQEHDVSFISISESFDTNTPSGRLTLQVLGAVAEFERERIRERVFENMIHAAKGGKWLTQSPYGYRLFDKELVIHEEEAKIVKRVYEAYLDKGMGCFAVAKMLNKEGIPSRFNKEWSLRSVKLMLTNPAYKGTLVWNRVDSSKKNRKVKDESEWVSLDECLPVIIDEDKWEEVQKRVNGNQIAPRAVSSPHLLGGLLKCGNCGSGMSIGWSGSKNNRYRVYRCSANKNKGTCTSKQYRADDVEQWFKEGLKRLVDSLDETLVPMIIEQQMEKDLSYIQNRIEVARKRYGRKVEAYSADLITIEDLKLEKDRMEQDIELLNGLKLIQEDQFDIEKIKKEIQKKTSKVLESLDVLTIEDAKSLIYTFVDNTKVLDYGSIVITIKV
ncbi:resolvase [Desulfuribacillus stibiiarsenatis]|uniref:Resolvase n=1 Tax=Desulfuribacillus stibiiarsenatis TaxID=1390249 RepID=A0A1E5L8V4_9FIRM|nr:recombinase family protein [Desulfuribacillus stibiiarsenatis]OEH86582.1 resolvase [Desulfuribacillus stibiiarsenatis]